MKNTWSLGRKLIVSFLGVAAITLAVGGVGYYGAVESERAIEEIGLVLLPSVESLGVIDTQAEAVSGILRALAITGLSREVRDEQYAALTTAREIYQAAWDIYEPMPQTAEEERVWQQFVPAWNAWREENTKAVNLCRQFDQIGVQNPLLMKMDLESFRAGHYRLQALVLRMLQHGQTFEGGESHTGCAFGQWIGSIQTDSAAVRQQVQASVEPHRQFHAALARARQLVSEGKTDEAQAVYTDELVPAEERTVAALNELVNTADSAITVMEQAEGQILGTVAERQQVAIGLLENLLRINNAEADSAVLASQAKSGLLKAVSIIAMVVGVVLAVGLGALISRSLNKALRTIADSLRTGAEQTASAAGQVSSASQQLASGASEQASALEETSSSLEEMSSMTRQNAANAKQAATLSEEAREASGRGGEAVQRMSEAIGRIKQSSDETARIIKVIDEIAFQTNLLALNAAVEAARAGEAGKGFAVVAEEVRNLAQRSAEAARNTSQLIEESQKNADSGVKVTEQVIQELGNIDTGIKKVSDLLSEVAAASDEQSRGVEQVNSAVSQMDKVTQDTASGAEESAAASEELSAQAEQLNQMVSDLVCIVNGASGSDSHNSRSRAVGSGGSGRATSGKAAASSSSGAGKRLASQASSGGAGHGRKASQKSATASAARQQIPLEVEDEAVLSTF